MNTISKENFIAIWKKISNDKRRMPTYTKQPYYGEKCVLKEKGFIYPEHHVLYNIARGLPLSRGFSEHTEGYRDALVFFRSGSPYKSYIEAKIYAPLKEYMSKEEYIAFIDEAKELAREQME